jgi:hypothetical protein
MIAAAGLATAVFLKGTDQVLRYSVDRSTVELLYLPVPARSRSQAKAFIDTVVWRTGDAAGALIVLAGVSLAHVTVPELSIVALVVIGAWILAAFTARRTYVDALRASIHEHRLDVERLAEQQAERSTLDVPRERCRQPIPRCAGMRSPRCRRRAIDRRSRGSRSSRLTRTAASAPRRSCTSLDAAPPIR